MKYQLKPISPNGEAFEFDTNDIFHLSKLGRSDEGVVYFDDVPYTIESKPGYKAAPPTKYVRELEAELLAMKAERDRLLTAATGIYNEILLHAPNIISRSQEFVRLAIALDAVAAGEVADEKEGEPAQT